MGTIETQTSSLIWVPNIAGGSLGFCATHWPQKYFSASSYEHMTKCTWLLIGKSGTKVDLFI